LLSSNLVKLLDQQISIGGSPEPTQRIPRNRGIKLINQNENIRHQGAGDRFGGNEDMRNIVSIIIPSYNSTVTLRRTLPSILAQERTLISDIIVVDSSDDGLFQGLVQEFESSGIAFIISGEKVMPAVQRNIGARASCGRLLLFLDSDVILESGYVAKIVDFYRQGRMAGFGSVTLPSFQARKIVPMAQYYLQLNEYLPSGMPRVKPFVLGCSNFVDRELFEKAGGYPEIRAAEDVVYGQSLSTLTQIWFIPQASVGHIFREDWQGYARNQRLLGKFVARYRKHQSESVAFRGVLPVLLFPAFLIFKAMRIFPRILAAGPRHVLCCTLVFPAFALGLVYWCLGFVEEAMRKD
jgi:glycosyltransferase involved in cell wall biosynthesis